MDRDQRRFFNTWLKNWNCGKPLDVNGNISYLFCYTYKVLGLSPSETALHLVRLKEAYAQEEKFAEYCHLWLSDCYVLLGDYNKAIEVFPHIPVNSRSATLTDDLLSLKLKIGHHIAGRDVLTLNGPKVTKWGRDHLKEITSYLDINIAVHEKHNDLNLLETWKVSSYEYPYSVFRGTWHSSSTRMSCFSFSGSDEVISFVREKTRNAENNLREELNMPRVGEGWIGETELYYKIRDAFDETEVLQHSSPEWLGKQHLDVFIPEYSVALEYQGEQHDKPVEFFGGLEAYLMTKKRDAMKKRKCRKNNIQVIEVRSGYELRELVQTVRKSIQ